MRIPIVALAVVGLIGQGWFGGGCGLSTAAASDGQSGHELEGATDWNLEVRRVPAISVSGPAGAPGVVEWALDLQGPWSVFTNLAVGQRGSVLVDLAPESAARFYRAVTGPLGPPDYLWIGPGTFWMGSPDFEPGRLTNEVQHLVTLTSGFWICDHEVTQAEYLSVIGSNPSFFQGATHPVESVNWEEAVEYCRKLTETERNAGRIPAGTAFRLPTEAEWEYACRAGTTGRFAGDLDLMAWYNNDNRAVGTQPVKTKHPNAWGAHDMHGNVWEWCQDWYGDYPETPVTDPTGPSSGLVRTSRGGGWFFPAGFNRSAFRVTIGFPQLRSNLVGFRTVLSN